MLVNKGGEVEFSLRDSNEIVISPVEIKPKP